MSDRSIDKGTIRPSEGTDATGADECNRCRRMQQVPTNATGADAQKSSEEVVAHGIFQAICDLRRHIAAAVDQAFEHLSPGEGMVDFEQLKCLMDLTDAIVAKTREATADSPEDHLSPSEVLELLKSPDLKPMDLRTAFFSLKRTAEGHTFNGRRFGMALFADETGMARNFLAKIKYLKRMDGKSTVAFIKWLERYATALNAAKKDGKIS